MSSGVRLPRSSNGRAFDDIENSTNSSATQRTRSSSNISEGFEQPTDRAFAKYLYTAKASTAEVRTRLKLCCRRGYLTAEEFAARDALGDEIARIANGLIKYLLKSNRRDRGLGRNATRKPAGPRVR